MIILEINDVWRFVHCSLYGSFCCIFWTPFGHQSRLRGINLNMLPDKGQKVINSLKVKEDCIKEFNKQIALTRGVGELGDIVSVMFSFVQDWE